MDKKLYNLTQTDTFFKNFTFSYYKKHSETFYFFCFYLFRLFPFPTEKAKPDERLIWRETIDRKTGNYLWEPSKQSRVCSKHFVDGYPTVTNPRPTLHLGNSMNLDDILGNVRRRLVYRSSSPSALPPVPNNDDAVVPDQSNDSFSNDADADFHVGSPNANDSFPFDNDSSSAGQQYLSLPSFFVFRQSTYRNMLFSCMVTVASLLCFGWML